MTYQENTKAKTITDAFFLSLQPVSAIFLGFLIVSAISKNITPTDLGIFSFFTMLYDWYTVFFLFMIPRAIEKYSAEYLGNNNKQMVQNLVKTSTLYILFISPIAGVISFFVTIFLFDFLSLEVNLSLFLLFCLVISSSILVKIITALGRGLQQFRIVGTISFIGSIVAQITAWILITIGTGISSLIFRWLLGNILIISLLIFFNKSLISLKGSIFPIKKLIMLSLPLLFSYLVMVMGQQTFLRVLLKNSFSLTDVGYFEFGMRLRVLISSLALGYHSVLTPYFALDYGHRGKHQLSRNLGWTIKFGSFIFSPLIIGAVAIGKIVFDIAFTEYLPAYPFFVILILGLWVVLLFNPFSLVLVAIGHPEKILIANIVSVLFGMSLTFLFTQFGAIGISLAWILMDLASKGIVFLFCRRYVMPYIDWKKTFMFFFIACFSLPLIFLEIYIFEEISSLLLGIVTFIVVYIILVRSLGLTTEREISIALGSLPDGLRNKISYILCKR